METSGEWCLAKLSPTMSSIALSLATTGGQEDERATLPSSGASPSVVSMVVLAIASLNCTRSLIVLLEVKETDRRTGCRGEGPDGLIPLDLLKPCRGRGRVPLDWLALQSGEAAR